MSRRENILNSVWVDPDFVELSPAAKLVYIWSFTNPHCNMAGLYRISVQTIAAETGLQPNRIERALAELEDTGFLRHRDRMLWVRARIKYLPSRSPSVATTIARDLRGASPHSLVADLLDVYGDCSWLRERLGGPDFALQSQNGMSPR